MDLSDIFKFFGAVLVVMSSIAAGVWWVLKQCFVTKEDHRLLSARVAATESAIKNLPTISDHHELLTKITEIHGNVKNTEEKIARFQRQTDRIEDFLFKGGLNQ